MLQVNSAISGFWNYAAPSGGITVTTAVQLKAAVTGRANLISTLYLCPTDAGVDSEVLLLRGSTVIWRGYVHSHAASQVTNQVIHFDPPLSTADGEALNIQVVTAGVVLYANACGYEGQRTHT